MMDLQLTCSKCGVVLTADNTRALPEGKGFVCKDCYDVGSPRLTRTGFADVSERKQPLRENTLSSEPSREVLGSADSFFDLKEYICHECGYSFKKNPEFPVHVCPYCGKRGTVAQKIDNAAGEFVE
ncbi:hypothetical protein K9M74_00610 [Candidatus Woesearchaeota archaeon]|nr:hypothetical protein [Candidatus Woesearchaeota archaeon]